MRRSLFVLLIIALAITAMEIYLAHLGGYVLVVLPHWTMQVPVWLAALTCLIFFLVVYFVWRGFRWLFTIHSRFQHWLKHRETLRAQRSLRQGIFALLADDLSIAQTKLEQAAKLHADPLFTQLANAVTAHRQGLYSQRDAILQKLQHENFSGRHELVIFQARLQMQAGDMDGARQNLEKLHRHDTKHAATLRLLAEIYYQQNLIVALRDILPTLKRRQWIDTTTHVNYIVAISNDLLLKTHDKESLLTTWRQLEELARQQFSVLQTYVQQLIKFQLGHEAEIMVRSRIEQQANDDLYTLYANIPHDTHLQILQVESWLKRGGASARLLFTAGQLCMRYQLWGKARDYFTSSLQKKPDAQVYAALAKLYDQIHDKDKADQFYKLGLELAAKA